MGIWITIVAAHLSAANIALRTSFRIALEVSDDAAVREKLYLKKYRFLRLFIESESAIIRVFFGREVP